MAKNMIGIVGHEAEAIRDYKLLGLEQDADNQGKAIIVNEDNEFEATDKYNNHLSNTSNPHNVTPAQIGAAVSGHTHGAGVFITSSWSNDTSWYRVWSNGWKEQGGYSGNTVTFPTAFTSKVHTFVYMPLGGSGDWDDQNIRITSVTLTGASLYPAISCNGSYWYACGF